MNPEQAAMQFYANHTWPEIQQMFTPRTSLELSLRTNFEWALNTLLASLPQLDLDLIPAAVAALNRELTFRKLCEIHRERCQNRYRSTINSPINN